MSMFSFLHQSGLPSTSVLLGKAMKTMHNRPPHSITTDKLGWFLSQGNPVGCSAKASYRRTPNIAPSKYLNNIIEADHGGLKRMIRPAVSRQMRTTPATIKGFEIMRIPDDAIASYARPRLQARSNSSTNSSKLLPHCNIQLGASCACTA
jgi:transposase-like protein